MNEEEAQYRNNAGTCLSGRTKELRLALESKYRHLIPSFRIVYAGGKVEGDSTEADAYSVVHQICNESLRTFGLVYRLVVPVGERMNRLREAEIHRPHKPATKKQTVRAIMAIEEAIDDEYLPAMFEGIRPDGEDWGDLTADGERIGALEKRQADLEYILSSFTK